MAFKEDVTGVPKSEAYRHGSIGTCDADEIRRSTSKYR